MNITGDNIIEVRNVCREFKVGTQVIHALTDVNVDVRRSRLTILRGRSGSGKTTLLNMMSTLDTPTSGEVCFSGRELSSLSEKEKNELRRIKTGFVFQSVALISTMTAYENIEFGMRVAGAPLAGRREKIMEWLDMVGLKGRYRHRPGELSGGEQQRIAIIRAIAHSPEVVFADEPTAELDTASGLKVVALFRELIKHSGVTVVMTSHDPNIIELADDMYELQDGCVVDSSTNKDVSDV